jgi:hypothetical protein
MMHQGHKAGLVSADQLLESARLLVADANHQAGIGISQGQLRAGLADGCHSRSAL